MISSLQKLLELCSALNLGKSGPSAKNKHNTHSHPHLSQRSRNSSCNRGCFNEYARPEPIFQGCIQAPIIQSQFTNMPIGRVRRSRCTDSRNHLGEIIRPTRRPQPDRLRVEIDLVRKIVPLPCFQFSFPVRGSANAPAKRIVLARGAASETVFKFSEMTLRYIYFV
jgi:hypothetical protein